MLNVESTWYGLIDKKTTTCKQDLLGRNNLRAGKGFYATYLYV